MSRVAVIADAHLGGPGGDAAPLIAQLAALPDAGCRRLVLLGDIFQVWVGSRQFETAHVRAFLVAVDDLRRRGIEVDYVEGNRDFFLAASPYAEVFDRVADEVVFEDGGRRFLAVHGDGLNERDRQYLFWRWLSKSAPVRHAMSGLPGGVARRLVDRVEARLSRTNFRHKRRLPEAAIRRYAERRLAEGHDVLLLGHFHEPLELEVEGGAVRVFDAWFRSRRVEWPAAG